MLCIPLNFSSPDTRTELRRRRGNGNGSSSRSENDDAALRRAKHSETSVVAPMLWLHAGRAEVGMSAVAPIRAPLFVHGWSSWRTPMNVSCFVVMSAVPFALGPCELYPRQAGFVRRALARLGVRDADVEDLTHDVFVVLHRKGATFENERRARAWLYATARRLASNERRARTRAELRDPAWVPQEPIAPDTAVLCGEVEQLVCDFTDDLPATAREVFRRTQLEGESAPAVAQELGLGLNTTYSHMRRTRQRFASRVAVVLGLLALLVAALAGTCSTERPDAERVALRHGAYVAG